MPDPKAINASRHRTVQGLCHDSLIYYICMVAPWFKIEEVHLVIADRLERCAEGKIDRLMLFLPPRTGKPVEENQLVLRGDGRRVPLKDIKIGDSVISHRGRGCRVEAVHVQGELPTVALTTRAGRTLVAALDHPVLTTNGWAEAGEILPGDVLATLNGCDPVGWIGRAPEEFRLAGYFIGDGNTTANRQGSFASNITCFDPIQRNDIRHCAEALGFSIGKSCLETRMAIKSGARNWLRKIGIAGVKSIHKRVPAFVFEAPNDAIAHFIGAYFACDGSIYQKSKGRRGWTIEFASANRLLLDDVQHLLMRLGIASTVTDRVTKDQSGKPFNSSRLSLYSEEETAKFAKIIPVFGVKNERLVKVDKPRAFKSEFVGDPVVKVEDAGLRPCRCLSVGVDQTFLASDLVVHNSTMTSVFFPSWWMGKFPSEKIMQIGYKTDLPRRFSRQTMGFIRSREYHKIFPGVQLARDAHAAGYWRIEDAYLEAQEAYQRGEYQAAGVTSGIAGSGFNLGTIDDPMSEQDKDSKIAKDFVWEWYGAGFYTRRQPEKNVIVLTMTRWATDDLAGHLIEEAKHGGDQFEILNIPAILDNDTAQKIYVDAVDYNFLPKKEMSPLLDGESFMPRRFSTKELLRTKANIRARDWNALYMGNPQEEEGAILKRRYWRLWPHKTLPDCIFIFQMYDTAFDASEKNDGSAMTTWGLFEFKDREGRPAVHMILLGRWKRHVDSPDLPKIVEAYCHGSRHMREEKATEPKWDNLEHEIAEKAKGTGAKSVTGFHPDKVLIENKASGINLVKELRRRKDPKIPVYPWNPPMGTRGQMGKYARAQFGALVLEQGSVWYFVGEGPTGDWAMEVIDECAKCKFDGSDEFDDLPDTVAASMVYVRQSYRLELESDIDEDQEAKDEVKVRKARKFYG